MEMTIVEEGIGDGLESFNYAAKIEAKIICSYVRRRQNNIKLNMKNKKK